MIYHAKRYGEHPIFLNAESERQAKAITTRLLEQGATTGQVISLVALDANGMPTDRVWSKRAHKGSGWIGLGDAARK